MKVWCERIMFNYDKAAKNAVEVLDKYDFSETLKMCRGVAVEDVVERLAKCNDKVANALHDLSIDEVVIYLFDRYKMRTEEVSKYYMWWNDRHEHSKEASEK